MIRSLKFAAFGALALLGACAQLQALAPSLGGAAAASITPAQAQELDAFCATYAAALPAVQPAAAPGSKEAVLIGFAGTPAAPGFCDPNTGKVAASALPDSSSAAWLSAILTGLKIGLPYVVGAVASNG